MILFFFFGFRRPNHSFLSQSYLFVCLFAGIKPKKLYSAACVNRGVNPLGMVCVLLCFIKGGPEPLEKEIHEILGSKLEARFSNPFFELVQKMCQVHFSYLLRLGNFSKAPRTLQKFPQKCYKIAVCWECAVYVRNLWLPRNLALPLRNDPVQTISRVNHGLTQCASVTPLLVLCLAFFNKKSVTKRK